MQLFILIETEKGSCRVRVREGREQRGGEGRQIHRSVHLAFNPVRI